MTVTRTILEGIAQLLDDNDVGRWSPDTANAAGDIAIVLSHMPHDPDQVISLTDYAVQSSALMSDTILGVQIRLRGDTNPGTVIDRRDAVFDVLHGLTHFQLGAGDDAVLVTQLLWQSAAALGPDDNGRHERSENYYAYFNRPHPRLE